MSEPTAMASAATPKLVTPPGFFPVPDTAVVAADISAFEPAVLAVMAKAKAASSASLWAAMTTVGTHALAAIGGAGGMAALLKLLPSLL